MPKYSQKVYMEGLPCYKYILKKLSDENDAKVFVKNYVCSMLNAGISQEDVTNSLLLLSSNFSSRVFDYDYMAWHRHTKGMSFCDDVFMDGSVILYKTCDQYYKITDKKCTACALCPLSKKYTNKNIEYEKNIIRFALESRENAKKLLSYSLTADLFNSVTNVLDQMSAADKPFIYPFYKYTFEALSDETVISDIFDEGMDYKDVLEPVHLKKLKENGLTIKKCKADISSFCKAMILNMLPDKACNEELFSSSLKKIMPDTGDCYTELLKDISSINQKNGVTNEKNTALGISECDSFYNPPKNKSQNKKKKPTKKANLDFLDLEKITENIDEELDAASSNIILSTNANTEKAQEQLNESFQIAGIPNETTETSANNNNSSDDISKEPEISPHHLVPYKFLSVIIPEERIRNHVVSENEPIVIKEIDRDDYYRDGNMTSDLLGIPYISKDDLKRFTISLESSDSRLISYFKNHVLRDECLSFELCRTYNKSFVIVFFVQRLHAYFSTDIRDSAMLNILKPIFSHSKIEKYTYNPFMIMGILANLGIKVRSLYSLFAVSSVLLPFHSYDPEWVLEIFNAKKAKGGITISPKGTIDNMALKYIHDYKRLFKGLRTKITKCGFIEQLKTINNYYQAMGISYYQSLYSKSKERLFTSKIAGLFISNTVIPDKFEVDGSVYSLSINGRNGASKMIMELLATLYSTDTFYSCDIMILSIKAHEVIFFIGKDDCEYLSTFINRFLLKKTLKVDNCGIEYRIAEMRSYSECTD
ncbi:MAG: hypothetical protein K6F84_00200 [Lachnospiraceae bacterium]|nr:hypothetical protein [Lachnospiraceae bacterium]